MKMTVLGEEITLNPKEVKKSREQISRIFSDVRKISTKNRRDSYYLTFVIMAHVISGNIIKTYDPDSLKRIIEVTNKLDKN